MWNKIEIQVDYFRIEIFDKWLWLGKERKSARLDAEYAKT